VRLFLAGEYTTYDIRAVSKNRCSRRRWTIPAADVAPVAIRPAPDDLG
jgi:hypothetical protein